MSHVMVTSGPLMSPRAVKGAPEHLNLLPWLAQLRWLEPATAEALGDRMDAEEAAEVLERIRREMSLQESQRRRRG